MLGAVAVLGGKSEGQDAIFVNVTTETTTMCGARVKHKTKRFERFFVRGRGQKGGERDKKKGDFFCL